MNKEITFDRFIRGVIAIGGCVIAYLLIDRLSGALLPFLIAWLFCYLVYPIVKFFQYRLRLKNRALSIFTVLLLFTALIGGICFLVIPPVIEESAMLKGLVTNYLTSGGNNATIPDVINEFIRNHINMQHMEAYFSADRVGELVKAALPKIWNVVTQSFNIIGVVIASIMVLV